MNLLIVDSVEVYLEGLKSALSPSFALSAKLLCRDTSAVIPDKKVDMFIFGFCDDFHPHNLEYARGLKKGAGKTIAILTADCLPFLLEITKIGFDSYLHRFAPKEIVMTAIKETLDGKTFIDRKIAPWLWELKKELPEECNLSEREKQVVDLLLRGFSNKEVAVNLFISENTVKFHIQNIFRKMGVKNRSEFQTACGKWFGDHVRHGFPNTCPKG